MSVPDFSAVVDTAMEIRAHEPALWQKFVDAMAGYSQQVSNAMVKCPPELLPRAQGMAIQANEIAGILRDAAQIQEARQQAMKNDARKQQQRTQPGQPFRA